MCTRISDKERHPAGEQHTPSRSVVQSISNDRTRVSDAARLQSMSRQIVERKAFRRDLVITGSCLEQTSEALSSDLYFYLPARASAPQPPFGTHGIALSEKPLILMDVVPGSGSIYPVFPAREVQNFPDDGESVLLVDGGFAQHSPVEAAALWGATHIVLIEASPKERLPRNNFLQNAVASFDHLYAQAQLIDAHSRGQVLMFTPAPARPHSCALDFADNLVAADVPLGYGDATIDAPKGTPRFQQEFGRPVFIDEDTTRPN